MSVVEALTSQQEFAIWHPACPTAKSQQDASEKKKREQKGGVMTTRCVKRGVPFKLITSLILLRSCVQSYIVECMGVKQYQGRKTVKKSLRKRRGVCMQRKHAWRRRKTCSVDLCGVDGPIGLEPNSNASRLTMIGVH